MENIEVAVRLRPLNQREKDSGDDNIWHIERDQKTIVLKSTSPQKFQVKDQSKSPMGRKSSLIGQSKVGSGQDAQYLQQQLQKQLQDGQYVGGNTRNPKFKTSSTFQGPHLQKTSSSSSLQSIYNQNTESSNKKKTTFNFDLCFRPEDSNYQIYQSMVKRIALSSLNGINGTVFVYGQTGAGKTYSMLGRERKEIIPMVEELTLEQLQKPKKKNAKQVSDFSLANFETNNAANAINMEMKYLSGRTQERVVKEEQPGILIYAMQDLFEEIEEDKEKTYFLRCSYIEIYNEQVYDLLRTEDSLLSEPLHLNEDKNKDFYIRGVIEEPVTCIEEILYYLRRGELNRHYAETKLNHASSRSHTLFRLQVQSITNSFLHDQQQQQQVSGSRSAKATPEKVPQFTQQFESAQKILGKVVGNGDLKKYVTQSVLNFVDLAGSEKVSSHYDNKDPEELYVTEFGDQTPRIDSNVKNRVREGKNINKSLFFLTQVISMRAEAKIPQLTSLSPNKSPQQQLQSHIPYRNSPLTKILRSSLGGNSRTSIIICVTPSRSQYEQTLSSLRFGQNAMKIENKVQANIIANNNDEAVKILIADYERKIKSLEKAKKDQQRQREQEMKIIEHILDEKKRLIDRLTSNNLKRLHQTSQLHLLRHSPHTQHSDQLLLSGVGIIDLTTTTDNTKLTKSSSININEVNMQVIQQQKQKLQMQQQQIDTLVQYTQQLQLQLEQQQNSSDASEECRVLRMKEQFYEHFDKSYMKQLDDSQLSGLITQFTTVTDLITKELMKREYRRKLEEVRDQLQQLQQQEADNIQVRDNLVLVQKALQVMDLQTHQTLNDNAVQQQQSQSQQQQQQIKQQQKRQDVQQQDREEFQIKSSKKSKSKSKSGKRGGVQSRSISPTITNATTDRQGSLSAMRDKTALRSAVAAERMSVCTILKDYDSINIDLPLSKHEKSESSIVLGQHEQDTRRSSCERDLVITNPVFRTSQDSFAMTYRESNEQIQSNNLFETLQNNIDTYGHQQMIVNSNEYVSFKQFSNKKIAQIVRESQQALNNLTNQSPRKALAEQLKHGQMDMLLRESLLEITNNLRQSLTKDSLTHSAPVTILPNNQTNNTSTQQLTKDQSIFKHSNVSSRNSKLPNTTKSQSTISQYHTPRNLKDRSPSIMAQIMTKASPRISSERGRFTPVLREKNYQTKQDNTKKQQQQQLKQGGIKVYQKEQLQQNTSQIKVNVQNVKENKVVVEGGKYQPLLSSRQKAVQKSAMNKTPQKGGRL